MKFFVVFAAIIAVAFATPSTWTLSELSEALENPSTNPVFKPVLEQALDYVMHAIIQGDQKPIKITTSAGVAATFTLAELDYTLQHPTVSTSVFQPYLENALNEMMSALFAGQPMETVDVYVPALELSYWSLQDIDAALSDDSTNPALVPYLKDALNELMHDLFSGGQQTSILLIVPADIVAPSPVVVPSPVAVGPAAPETPVSNNPLVQIILNVQQSNVVDVVGPSPVVDRPMPEPSEVNPIDIIAVLPIEALEPSPAAIVGPMV